MRYFRRDILSKNSADPSICRCLNGFLSGLFINIHKMFYEIDLIALHDSIPGNIFCTYSSLWQSINNPRRNGVFSKVIAHKISHSSDADFIETNLQPNKSLSFHKELELWQDEPFWYCCITGPPKRSRASQQLDGFLCGWLLWCSINKNSFFSNVHVINHIKTLGTD